MKKLLFAGVAAVLTLAGVQAQAADANTDTAGGMHDTTGNTGSTGSMGNTGSMGSTGSTMGSDTGTAGVMGTVKDIDKKKGLVSLQLQLAPGASIMRNGQMVKIDQLKKGDDVRANFDPTTNSITQINVEPKGSMNQNMNK